MNVSPAHGKPQAVPRIDPSQNLREQKEEGESFEEVLAATLRSQIALQGPLPDGEDAPKVDTAAIAEVQLALSSGYRPIPNDGMPAEIGEDAVRFDARPLLGRSFVTEGRFERPLSVSEERAPVERPVGEIVEFGPDIHRALMMAAPHIEVMARGPVGWSISTALAPRQPGGSARSAVAQAGEAPTPLRASRWGPPGSPSASAPAPEGGKSELRAQISLTFLADEVLVTVRGLALSADEEEALAEEARGLLSSTDFGDRPLRVVTSRRA